jgi:predicted kinase
MAEELTAPGLVLIMRGLSGSGKSRWAEHYKEKSVHPVTIISADSYFGAGKEWVFEPAKLNLAHALCFKSAVIWATEPPEQAGSPRVLIVDNTNAAAWEIAPYIQLANAYGFAHSIVYLPCDPIHAFSRSVHKTPFKVVWQKHVIMQTESLAKPGWNLELRKGD